MARVNRKRLDARGPKDERKLDNDVLDLIRAAAPEVADAVEKVSRHHQSTKISEDEESYRPPDLSYLLNFEYEGKKLTPAELDFVVAFVGNNFKLDSRKMPCTFATKPAVLAALHEVTRDCIVRFEVNPDRLVRELVPLIEANISDLMDIDATGITMKDFSKLPRHITAAVQEVHEVRNAQGTQLRVKLYDKLSAINTLNKMLGFNREKGPEVEVNVQVVDRLSSALNRLKDYQGGRVLEHNEEPVAFVPAMKDTGTKAQKLLESDDGV